MTEATKSLLFRCRWLTIFYFFLRNLVTSLNSFFQTSISSVLRVTLVQFSMETYCCNFNRKWGKYCSCMFAAKWFKEVSENGICWATNFFVISQSNTSFQSLKFFVDFIILQCVLRTLIAMVQIIFLLSMICSSFLYR